MCRGFYHNNPYILKLNYNLGQCTMYNLGYSQVTRPAIRGPRCEGHLSGGKGDATTDDPFLLYNGPVRRKRITFLWAQHFADIFP